MWATVPTSRHVLAVARTTTSVNRLLDVLPVFGDDTRIRISFTVDEGSAFSTGLADRLRTQGLRVISWADAVKTAFNLVLAASDHSDLHELTGPLMLLPHGAGFQKYSPHQRDERDLSGLSRSALWHDQRPVPARIGLSHYDQQPLLASLGSDIVDRGVVIGDPLSVKLV
jgi:hypothetical protein